jgi:outer membrane protein TolC
MSHIASAILAGLALVAIGARSETLEDAWRIAQEQDLSLAAAESRIAAAEADLGAASSERRLKVAATASLLELDSSPAFDFSAAGLDVEMPLLDGSTLKTAAATVTLPVYTSGMTGAGINAARAGLDVERRAAAALSQQVRLAVAERYISVLRAGSAVAVAGSNVASLAAHVREVEDMFEAGSVPRNDYLAASVSLADAEQRRLQAQNALAVARASYNRALGRALDEPFELEAELPPVDSRIGRQNAEALTGLALVQREEPGRLQSAADALAARAESAAATAGPQLSLTGGYQWLENEFLTRDDYWMLGIGVQWSLFDGGRARNRANALSLQSEALKRQRRDLQSMIALDVREAWLTRDESERRVTVTERALAQAEENLRVTRDRYRNGEGANSDVLDAEALRSMSLYNHDAARYDAALARYRLGYAVGLL